MVRDEQNIARRGGHQKSCALAMLLCAAALPGSARAMQLYADNGVTVTLNTTIGYSGVLRVNDPSQTILNDEALFNDGDQNFKHGLVSNQFEILPVLSVHDGNFGVHISGEAYLDTAYLTRNQNSSPQTLDAAVSYNRNFARATANIDGRNAQLLDAFAYDSYSLGADGSQSLTLKVGRQTLLWGQSLFFTNNCIAGGQAPIDINKALTLANPQAQQIFMPVGQVALTYQPNDTVTIQGYYQFEWRGDQFPGSGSYFSPADFIGPGAGRLIVGEFPFQPLGPAGPTAFLPVYFARVHDLLPASGNGQFGLSAQFQLGNFDLGVYGLRFDSKAPQFYLHPLPGPAFGPQGAYEGDYNIVYPKDIQLYGASLSTTLGPVNVAGEISGRRNQPLFSEPVAVIPGLTPNYNENSTPGYAVGNTVNAQLSAIYVSGGLPLMPGGMTVLAEIEDNQVIEVTANRAALFVGRTPNGMGTQIQATPIYYNALPRTNLTIPVGITWYPTGRSQFDQTEQAGTGVLNIGVGATYSTVWAAGINYKDYLGSTSIISSLASKQAFADKGYVSFYLQRTF